MKTMSVRQAYEEALKASMKYSDDMYKAKMVACMAVKKEMSDTLENLVALQNIMREIQKEYVQYN